MRFIHYHGKYGRLAATVAYEIINETAETREIRYSVTFVSKSEKSPTRKLGRVVAGERLQAGQCQQFSVERGNSLKENLLDTLKGTRSSMRKITWHRKAAGQVEEAGQSSDPV